MGGITTKKIGLYDINQITLFSTPNHPNSQGGLIIRTAKLLQNIENKHCVRCYFFVSL